MFGLGRSEILILWPFLLGLCFTIWTLGVAILLLALVVVGMRSYSLEARRKDAQEAGHE